MKRLYFPNLNGLRFIAASLVVWGALEAVRDVRIAIFVGCLIVVIAACALHEAGTAISIVAEHSATLTARNRPPSAAPRLDRIEVTRLPDLADPITLTRVDHRFEASGGRLVAAGTPEEVARVAESYTGRFLAELLKPAPALAGRR